MKVNPLTRAAAVVAALSTPVVATSQDAITKTVDSKGVIHLSNAPAKGQAPATQDSFTPTKRHSHKPPSTPSAEAPKPGETVCYVGKLTVDAKGTRFTLKPGGAVYEEPSVGYTVNGLNPRSNPDKTGWSGGKLVGVMATDGIQKNGDDVPPYTIRNIFNPSEVMVVRISASNGAGANWDNATLTNKEIIGGVVGEESTGRYSKDKGITLGADREFYFNVHQGNVPNVPVTSLTVTNGEQEQGTMQVVKCKKF